MTTEQKKANGLCSHTSWGNNKGMSYHWTTEQMGKVNCDFNYTWM